MFVEKPLLAQAESLRDSISTDANKTVFAGYPIVFFTPETNLGFGAAGICNFFPGKIKSKRPSQIQLGGGYTLNKQILSFIFYKLFLNEGKSNVFGEIGYYDYFYDYFGIGNTTLTENREKYFVRFPRIQFNWTQRIFPKIYVGGNYFFDDYNITSIDSTGLLFSNKTEGYESSRISNLGLLISYDSRDHVFYPEKGMYHSLNIKFNRKELGASSNFNEVSTDLRFYQPVGTGVFAFQIWAGKKFGEIPFQEYFLQGGPRYGRGMITGRFRDRSVFSLQWEYRFPIWKRFSGACFSSFGNVGQDFQDVFSTDWKLNFGAGLRFAIDKQNKTNIRLDVAGGSEELAFYLTIGEAF